MFAGSTPALGTEETLGRGESATTGRPLRVDVLTPTHYRQHQLRKVAGYGLPGRLAKPCDFLSHVGSNPMPSAFAKRLDGETDIMSRFEREVPGSNPGRAALVGV